MDSNDNSLKVFLTPHRSALLEGHSSRMHVLLRLQAPDLPEAMVRERKPYGISFVIDRSGSMSGEPLNEAKRCVGFMAERLKDVDLAALVTFDNRISTELPLTAMAERTKIYTALAPIAPGGNTNLHGGWLEGTQELQRTEPAVAVKRVVLLSDGCANEGITDTEEITRQAAALAAQGITTSTYGLGRNFNEELMVGLATAGQGSHYYAETAEDLLESFNEEFELMANLWSRGLAVKVSHLPGLSVRLMNEYPAVGSEPNLWRLPNIAYGSEAWAMFELTILPGWTGTDGEAILTAEISGADIDGVAVWSGVSLPVLPFVNATAFAAIAEDELVSRRLDEVMSAEYLSRARQAVHAGDWDTATRILEEAKARFRNSTWAQEVLQSMEKLAARRDDVRFRKEGLYSEMRMSRRLSSKDEGANLDAEQTEQAYLRRKTAQGKAQFVKRDPGNS